MASRVSLSVWFPLPVRTATNRVYPSSMRLTLPLTFNASLGLPTSSSKLTSLKDYLITVTNSTQLSPPLRHCYALFPGKAASVADMCITPSECLVRLGDFGQYCPVSLADRGELVDCSVNPSLEFAAEFRGRYYKMASRVELELFLADPARYVPPLAPRKLPDLELLPKRRTAAEVKTMFPKQIELKGYCPVTYLDGKLR